MTFFGEIFLINFGGLTLQKSDVCIDILFILEITNCTIAKYTNYPIFIW